MKRKKYPNVSTIEYVISNFSEGIDALTDENVTDFDRAVNSYNFDFKNGALTESFGFETLTHPSTHDEGSTEYAPTFQLDAEQSNVFVKIAHYKEFDISDSTRKDRLFLVGSDFIPSYARLINRWCIYGPLRNVLLTACPNMANYNDGQRDAILFFSDSDRVYSWNAETNAVQHSNVPLIHDFCVYKNRVFAVLSGERLTIRTQPENLLLWDEQTTSTATFLNFDNERGYINKLVCFNGYMFAIRDFGISRIMWYESDKTANITHMLSSGTRLYANTACVCGDKCLVLGKDGIYQFDNVSVKKLNLKLNRMFGGVSNQNAVAAFRHGIYYLACRLNFGDNQSIGSEQNNGFVNNALIAYDTQTGKYSISRGVDISYLCTVQYDSADKLLACFNGTYSTNIGQLTDNGTIFGANQTKYWCSPLTDMGFSNKIKYVKEISVLSLYDIKLCVFSENEKREFDIKGGNIISRVPVRIKGKQIGISIKSTTQKAYVSNLKLTLNLVDNEYV